MEEQKPCNCYAGCCDLLCVLEQAIIALIQAKESNKTNNG